MEKNAKFVHASMKAQLISLIPLKSFQNNTKAKFPIKILFFYFYFYTVHLADTLSKVTYSRGTWAICYKSTPGLLERLVNKPRPELKCKEKINII